MTCISPPVIVVRISPLRHDGGKAAKPPTATPQPSPPLRHSRVFSPLRHSRALPGNPVLHSRVFSPFRHSRALPGNPVLHREHHPGFPPAGENDGDGECDSHSLPSVMMAAKPKTPNGYAATLSPHPSFSGPARESRLSFIQSVVILALPRQAGNPPLMSPPSVMLAHFLPSVILGPCPGIQSVTQQCESPPWIPAYGEHDGREASEHPVRHFRASFLPLSFPRISFCRHSRALPGNPVLKQEHHPGFPPTARMTAGRPASIQSVILPLPRQAGNPPPSSSPSVMLAYFLPSVILGPCPGIQSVTQQCESPPWIPAYGENDGREASEHPVRHSRASFLPLSFPRISFCRHSRALPGNPVPKQEHHPGFPPTASMTAGEASEHDVPVVLSPSSSCVFPPAVILGPCPGSAASHWLPHMPL